MFDYESWLFYKVFVRSWIPLQTLAGKKLVTTVLLKSTGTYVTMETGSMVT